MLVRDNFITHRLIIYRLNIIFNKSLHIFGAIVDAVVDFRVRQLTAIPKRLQRARTDLQCQTDILIIHPIAHTPATTLAIDTIHSFNELPEARYKLLKGFFLNTNNLHNYFIFTLNIRLFHEPTFARQSKYTPFALAYSWLSEC